jgi:hypothetical protein
VRPSLRETLADTHIAAVTIAVLLAWTLDGAFRALWGPLSSVAGFLFTGVAVLDIPYVPPGLSRAGRLIVVTTFLYLSGAIISLSAAWLLSRWVFGVGPLRSLSRYRARLTRRNHV